MKLPTKLTLQDFREHKAVEYDIKEKETTQISKEQTQMVSSLINSYQPQTRSLHSHEFVRTFLLLKINNMLQTQCPVGSQFVLKLIDFHNKNIYTTFQYYTSNSDAELFTQIVAKAQLIPYIKLTQFQNLVQGCAILATTVIETIKAAEIFIRKYNVCFALCMIALKGRIKAFTPIVHREKNHKGQLQYAEQINRLTQTNEDIGAASDQESKRIQDPYSMRCTPHVHGIAYDALSELKNTAEKLINKFHCQTITIDGQVFPNLDLQSDTQTLKLDFLMAALHEIGSMSFIRSERILNQFLGKNKLQQNGTLYWKMQKYMIRTVDCVSKNKILSAPLNADTMNICNYQADVYYSSAAHTKTQEMLDNLYKILTLECLVINQCLKDIDFNPSILTDPVARSSLEQMQQKLNLKDRLASIEFITHDWII